MSHRKIKVLSMKHLFVRFVLKFSWSFSGFCAIYSNSKVIAYISSVYFGILFNELGDSFMHYDITLHAYSNILFINNEFPFLEASLRNDVELVLLLPPTTKPLFRRKRNYLTCLLLLISWNPIYLRSNHILKRLQM